ncbi:hypothetical protein [Microbulbifer spongiae]|uniref:Uncharacterized protein n=1 Tax=Microbulbifer spongiae TaxID=2944933 RepID=A0ABY9EFX8_9GAMM|nr:hypothetical protein [Microbulbifer sp. MI-G]WKD50474.1 hypothetical protein M8T91_03285 [Microbulbifer sp. MI-G]
MSAPCLLIWFVIASITSARNNEYENIVNAISKTEQLGQCAINTNVERNWPFSWTPASMKVSLTKDDVTVKTSTRKFFLPDRIEQSPGSYYYYFNWSEIKESAIIPSFLEFELDRQRELKWIKVGKCPPTQEKIYFDTEYGERNNNKTYEECKNLEYVAIKCS